MYNTQLELLDQFLEKLKNTDKYSFFEKAICDLLGIINKRARKLFVRLKSNDIDKHDKSLISKGRGIFYKNTQQVILHNLDINIKDLYDFLDKNRKVSFYGYTHSEILSIVTILEKGACNPLLFTDRTTTITSINYNFKKYKRKGLSPEIYSSSSITSIPSPEYKKHLENNLTVIEATSYADGTKKEERFSIKAFFKKFKDAN